jgi:hypothetical protein
LERNTGFEPATLRLGNEAARHSRFSPPLHESARPSGFLRVFREHPRPRFHESPRGFSSLMCPACATIAPQYDAPVTRCCAGGSATGMFDRARLPAVQAGQAASLPRCSQRNQVRLQGTWPGSLLHVHTRRVSINEPFASRARSARPPLKGTASRSAMRSPCGSRWRDRSSAHRLAAGG